MELNKATLIASKIKELLKEKKISATKMLNDCGLNKNTLSTMQSGGYLPRLETITQIADYLDCSVDYLLGRTASPSVGSVVLTPAADFSSLEEDHIKKYRQLSQQGKQTVDGLIDNLLLMNGAEPQEKEVQRTVLENA